MKISRVPGLTAVLLTACGGPGLMAGGSGAPDYRATELAVPPPASAPEVPAARAEYFRKAFSGASRFAARPIPRDMLASLDHGNELYVEAHDAGGGLLGYLRDFTGPVAPAGVCPCSPMSLTLVFDARLELVTILTPAPLEKRDHVRLTDAELARLITLAQSPPAALVERTPSDLADAVTGATRPELASLVVPGAALLTRRVVTLVQETRRILQAAPLAWDRRRLSELLETPATDAAVARALAQLLPTTQTLEMRRQAFLLMVRSYTESLRAGGGEEAAVEARLLDPALDRATESTDVLEACYTLATEGVRVPLAERCLGHVKNAAAAPPDPTALARLSGTLRFLAGDRAGAVNELLGAATAISQARDPRLHLRLSEALRAAGHTAEACKRARALYAAAPLLPGAEPALGSCREDGEAAPVARELQEEQRRRLLATRRDGDTPAAPLPLESAERAMVDLDPAQPGVVTVLVFFSTWCPHCLQELPRINAFLREVEERPELEGRVRVFGVRTAVERESIPYESFLERAQPRFPILYDATMSLAFAGFVRALGLKPALPTVAVIDPEGVVRFVLEPGDFRDTGRELMWAVQALLEAPIAQP